MSYVLDRYIDRVLVYANRSPEEAQSIRAELKDHLLEKVEHLKTEGLSAEDALFKAIEDHGAPHVVGYRLRPRFPLLDVRARGTARGVIAIGPRAVGVFAFGGAAVGVFACGGLAVGLVSFGGLAVALLFCWGGMGIAGVSFSGLSIGLLAMGGMACGIVATGGVAVGLWVPNAGLAISYYNAASVPEWLRSLGTARFMSDPSFAGTFTLYAMPVLIVSILVPQILMYREMRRIKRSEPWLVE